MTACFQTTKKYNFDSMQLLHSVQTAISRCGFELTEVNDEDGQLLAKSGFNWKSWGEYVVANISKDGEVDISSECAMSTQIVDWGKNKDNVNRIFHELDKLFGDKANVITVTDSDYSGYELIRDCETEEIPIEYATEEFPINNTLGNKAFESEHEFSKTVTNEIEVDASESIRGKLKADLVNILTAEIENAISRNLGFIHGETITRRYTLRFSVGPGDAVVYSIIWKRILRKGQYEIIAGGNTLSVPYQTNHGLTYEIQTRRA